MISVAWPRTIAEPSTPGCAGELDVEPFLDDIHNFTIDVACWTRTYCYSLASRTHHRHRRLLRARRDRPRRRRAAEQRNELAPLHSITSSARASSVGGTSRPSILGGLDVDDQLELGRLHDRQVSRLLTLEDTAGIDADLTPRIRNVGSVAYQSAGFGEFTRRI